MKKGIHPTTQITKYVCNSCKTTFDAISTVDGTVNVEVCSNCHPHYTGQAGVIVDTYSRVDRFQKHSSSADKSVVLHKRKKQAERRAKTSEINAGPKVTLRDMLKQVSA